MRNIFFAILSVVVLIFSTSINGAEMETHSHTVAQNSIQYTEGAFSCNWSDVYIDDILCRTIPQTSASGRRINPTILFDTPSLVFSVKQRYPYSNVSSFQSGTSDSFKQCSIYLIGQLRI